MASTTHTALDALLAQHQLLTDMAGHLTDVAKRMLAKADVDEPTWADVAQHAELAAMVANVWAMVEETK